MISILPIVFDRIEAYAKPLYGFQNTSLATSKHFSERLGPSQDLEQMVLEFLRRQEKAGSPTIAVSVVIDAVKTSNLHIERGYTVVDSSNTVDSTQIKEAEAARLEWPAVYMRTTTHRALSINPGGLLGGMRRSASRKDRVTSRSHEDDSITSTPSSKILHSWSVDGSPVARSRQEATQLNVLEYAPDSGSVASSWPHSSWNSLVALLTGKNEIPSSPLQEEEDTKTSFLDRWERASIRNLEVDFKSLAKWPGSVETAPSDSPLLSSPKTQRSSVQTSYHISALSDYTWLVIMVKVGEESRWHRRRANKLIEEEVQSFLSDFSTHLRVGNWFRASHAHKLRQEMMKPLSSASSSGYRDFDIVDKLKMKQARKWDKVDLDELLQSLKGAFRLRSPRRPLVDHTIGFQALSKSPRRQRRIPRSSPLPSLEASAAAFFIGPDLMYIFE